MSESDLRRVLKTLTKAAERFAGVAAKHKRIETERQALQDAITEAQLFLSVKQPSAAKTVLRSIEPKRRPRAVEARNQVGPHAKKSP
jgi:hypothetical protein